LKIAVTGAGGFLGRALIERLSKDGHSTLAIVKNEKDLSDFQNDNITPLNLDISKAENCVGVFSGCDSVIHCAAYRKDYGRWDEFKTNNLDITLNVMEGILESGVPKVIHISTTAVYGNERNHYGTDEETDYGERVIDYYTQSKIEAEKIILEYVDQKKLPAVILRPGYIWGTSERRMFPYIINGLKAGRLFFADGSDNVVSLTYIDNLVEAIVKVLEKDDVVGKIFNITDGSKITSKKFVSDIVNILGIEYKFRSWPYPLLYGMAMLSEWYYRLTIRKSRPPFTRYAARFFKYDAVFDISKAINELDYQPVISYSEGLTLITPFIRYLYYGSK